MVLGIRKSTKVTKPFLKKPVIMLKMRKMGHFWARKELFLIFLEHTSLEFFDFLHKVRQLCLLIIFIFCLFWKNRIILKMSKKRCVLLGPKQQKYFFLKNPLTDFLFFFMKVGSNKCKNMTKPGFWKKLYIMLKMRKMGHFWARNELFLIFLEHPSLEFFDFLHKVRQLCLLIIFIFCLFWKNRIILKMSKKRCVLLGPKQQKYFFLKNPLTDFLFFFMKVGSNKCKNMTKPGFWKKLYIMLKMRKMGHFWARNELFLIFLEHPSLEFFDFLHKVRQSCLLIIFIYCLFWKIPIILKMSKKRFVLLGPEQLKYFFLKKSLSDFFFFSWKKAVTMQNDDEAGFLKKNLLLCSKWRN